MNDCMCEFAAGCGGLGVVHCNGCGGDLCVCACGGEIDCDGCEDCDFGNCGEGGLGDGLDDSP